MIVVAAVCGMLIVAGLLCAAVAIAGVSFGDEETIRPPSRILAMARAPFAAQRWRRVLIAVIAGMLVLLLTGWPVAALATTAGVIVGPYLLSKRPAERRIARLVALEQWTRKLGDVLGASRALEDALMLSVRQVPEPIAAEVETLARRLRARMPAEDALRLWADEMADPVGDQIAAALILAAAHRGPGLRKVLVGLADVVARDVAHRQEIEASRAQHRTTLRWVLAFVVAYTVFVSLRHSYSAPFDTFPGQVAMGVVVLLYGAGFFWIHRLATPEPQPRLLSRPQEAYDAGRESS
jgi:Flp pilus assembly protein TadB